MPAVDEATRHGDEATRHGDEATRHGDEATRHGDEATRHGDEATRHGDEATRHGDEYEAGSNFVLYEHAVQATNDMRIWVGRTTHRLRRTDEGLRIAAKKVELVNSTSALPNMAFII